MSTEPIAARGADHTARLLISCPDGPGIVAAVSTFLYEKGANIVASDQYSTHPEHGTFFMRNAFYLPELENQAGRHAFKKAFAPFAEERQMQWRLAYAHDRKRVTIMASREDHCLLDLLWRTRRAELDMEVTAVISNHTTVKPEVDQLGVPFHHVPISKDTKLQGEKQQIDIIRATKSDFVILARYMQILSGDFLKTLDLPVINIHHSFLPAFAGAQPYRRAYERGVKLIGATAHYATEELDAGPIIEQDVQRVAHTSTIDDLERVGRDLERIVLARAVRNHIDDRILVHEGRTIVF